jgi:hypothetical protein
MFRTTLKSLTARMLRLLLTATAIVLGVAFATGALVLTDTSTRLFDEQFAESTAGVDVIVRATAAFGSAMGVEVERDPVPAEALNTIRTTDGVAGAEGSVRGSALLVVDGEAVVPGGPSVGLSWGDAPYSPYRLADGRPPRTDGEVVVDVATAEAYGVLATPWASPSPTAAGRPRSLGPPASATRQACRTRRSPSSRPPPPRSSSASTPAGRRSRSSPIVPVGVSQV